MNVIKWRQLSNGAKLTPKTDLIVKRTYSEDVYGHFDITGTQKSDGWLSASNVQSVGKGQYCRIWTNGGIPQFQLMNKSNNSQVNFLVIGTDVAPFRLKNQFTFLGQCFKEQGDEDRYVFLNATDVVYGQSGGNYATTLFNIDKWEVVGIAQNSDSVDDGVKQDFTFDGVDKVYFIFKDTIRFITIDSTGQTSWGELKDNNGNVVAASGIYGISTSTTIDTGRLVYKTVDNKVKVLLFNDLTLGNSQVLGTNGTVAMCPAGDTIFDFDQSQSFVVSKEDGVFLMRRSNSIQIKLSSSTVEKALNVIHFKHTPNVETEIWLGMINTGNHNKFVRKFRVDWSAGYGDLGVVSNVLVGTLITAGSSVVWESEIANTCNSYDIGKFYNYGLQKKWDTNNEKMS